jgi:hypothetical protein
MPNPRIILARLGLVLLSLACVSLSGRGVAAAQTTLLVDVDREALGVQSDAVLGSDTGRVAIDIVVQNATDIGAFEFELAYPTSVSHDSWSEGPFLTLSGRTSTCNELITERSSLIGCNTLGPTPAGVSGSGVLATVLFRTAVTSKTCFVLTMVETATVDGEPITTAKQSGCATIVIEDSDHDEIADAQDNCSDTFNPEQANLDAGNATMGLPGADNVGDACDEDIDGDGCSNERESGNDPWLGGKRDALNPWDFFDVDGSGSVGGTDIALVKSRFGTTVGQLEYDVKYDRSAGPHPWSPGPPTGTIGAAQVALIKASAGHFCMMAP